MHTLTVAWADMEGDDTGGHILYGAKKEVSGAWLAGDCRLVPPVDHIPVQDDSIDRASGGLIAQEACHLVVGVAEVTEHREADGSVDTRPLRLQ